MPPYRCAHGTLGSCAFLPFTIASSLRFLPHLTTLQLSTHQMAVDCSFDLGCYSLPDNDRTEVLLFSLGRSNCILNGRPGFNCRIHAVTERNKWLGGALLSLIVAQLAVGIALTVRAAVRPSEFFSSFPSARRLRPHLVPQLPDIDLDSFKLCTSAPWKLGYILFLNIGVAFGAPPSSNTIPHREF